MIPDNITEQHVLQAIERIDKEGIKWPLTKSRKYDLLFNEKVYPPKYIFYIANEIANGDNLSHLAFHTSEAITYLKKLNPNFVIQEKSTDQVKDLVEKYKGIIRNNGIEGELYKWQLLEQFRGKPDVDAEDFNAEIRSIKFSNLIYQLGLGVIKDIAKERTEACRDCFKALFDENTDLKTRLKFFDEETLKIYREFKPDENLSNFQDERSMSTYLTFHNPDKYTFFKDSFYKKFCKLLGIEAKKKGEKYIHYLELINDFIDEYINDDQELIDLIEKTIPAGYFNDTQHKILAQDILFQTLENTSDAINYWIFQANPELYNVVAAINANALGTWRVTRHKEDIKAGDKIILWLTGKAQGCYALCEVISEVYEGVEDEIELKYYSDKNTNVISPRVRIKITHNLTLNPITKTQIETFNELAELKIGNQGTNFSATKEEYETLLDIINSSSNEIYLIVKESLDKGKVNIFLSFLRDFVKSNNLKPDDERLSFNVRKSHNRLVFIVGSRYTLSIEKKNNKTLFSFISKNIVSKNFEEFKNPKIETEAYWNSNENISGFEEVINEGILIELNRSYKCPFRKYSNHEFMKDVFQLDINMNNENNKMEFPLNTIFYGPPGTGKTYNTVLRAAQIIENRIITDYPEALSVFNKHLGDRLEFITFHQNYSYEDFIQGLRPDVENEGSLSFERKDGVFKRIADRALKNLKDAERPTEAKRNFDIVFNEFISPLNNGDVEEIEIPMKKVSYYITSIGNKSIDFRKNDGDSKHSLSIDTLKKMYDKESNDLIIGGLQPYYNPILSILLEKGKYNVEKISRENFVIIIDEINRANISRVFGELITLIECDKRSHGEIPLRCTLPSGEEFIVPSNLYIIGTMNTADKSIALLDIALRRRFEFEAMYPLYKIEGFEIDDVEILQKINKRIKELKGHDFQIGHSYFMGKNSDLIERMNKKVIPLLLEYFMNDEKEVKGILLSAGLSIVEDSWPLKINGIL